MGSYRKGVNTGSYNPPQLEKFCMNCNFIRSFKYNRNIGHSECVECGMRFGIKLPEQLIKIVKGKSCENGRILEILRMRKAEILAKVVEEPEKKFRLSEIDTAINLVHNYQKTGKMDL